MYRNKYGRGKCDNCQSFHWELELNEDNNIVNLKCCMCKKIEPFRYYKRVEQLENEESE